MFHRRPGAAGGAAAAPGRPDQPLVVRLLGLDNLPDAYDKELFGEKCDTVYRHVFENYYDDGRSVYSVA